MSAFAAKRMGFGIAVVEKKKKSPAGQIADHELKGWVNSSQLLKKLAAISSVVTLENEFVDYHRLEYLESLGRNVFPSSQTISLIQDKLIQKETLASNNIPLPRFLAVNHKTDYEEIVESIGLPFILKSRKMGYDGYGNALIKSKADFLPAFDSLTRRHSKLLAEEFVDFKMELAVMVARTKKEIRLYPLTQTIQKNHICHTVIAPAQVNNRVYKLAGEIAIESVLAVKGFGIFGVELFYTNDGKILVNEMAPRPHNSGHYTIEGCCTSQFENHIRAVLNLPLGSTEMVMPHAVMINLLGKRNGPAIVKDYSTALKNDKVHLHIYGKEESRIGRKMGHITVIGDNADKILKIAKRTEKNTII
ncbi:MAG: 5-(carboxyamino)imidazole ribonucleotide synthase [Ignavibacteria bacterium]|nr:5-(carboxyamino)imidazole ribonucleotide synthase [Ignavibacteria bacterium]